MQLNEKLIYFALSEHVTKSACITEPRAKVCLWTFDTNLEEMTVLINFQGRAMLLPAFSLRKGVVKNEDVLMIASVKVNDGAFLLVHLSFCDNITVLQERFKNNNE